jgi:uncharacterized protein YqjF (DUF2071 family)
MYVDELLRATHRQAAALDRTGHRPWLRPDGSWLLGQSWVDLAFLHWRVPEEAVRRHVPAQLEVDTFDGEAWLGMTPFLLTGLRLRATVPLPGLSEFPELNVRTYVTDGEKPGIWFFSLDAASGMAVAAARRFYRLPYRRARTSIRRAGGLVRFTSTRTEPGSFPSALRASYSPAGTEREPQPGTLEHFLTERYCLYAMHQGRLLRAEIHHPPWRLRDAQVAIEESSMAPRGLEPGGEPLAHFAARQDVVIWPVANAGRAAGVSMT